MIEALQLRVMVSAGLPALLYRKNQSYQRAPWASSAAMEEWRYVCTIGHLRACRTK